jgi:hypothetical protein
MLEHPNNTYLSAINSSGGHDSSLNYFLLRNKGCHWMSWYYTFAVNNFCMHVPWQRHAAASREDLQQRTWLDWIPENPHTASVNVNVPDAVDKHTSAQDHSQNVTPPKEQDVQDAYNKNCSKQCEKMLCLVAMFTELRARRSALASSF